MKKSLIYMLVLCFGVCVLGCGGGEKKTTGTKAAPTDTKTTTPGEKAPK